MDSATAKRRFLPAGFSSGILGARTLRTALLALALMWPAFANGGVFPFYDTVSYLKGGVVALEKLQRLASFSGGEAVSAPAHAGENATLEGAAAQEATFERDEVSGMRSATYSIFIYLTALMSENGLLIAAAQSVAIAFMIVVFLQKFAPGLSVYGFLGIAALLALLTTAPWYASYAMPDIFTGAVVLAAALFFFRLQALSLFEKITITAITAFAITAHSSNLLLFAGLIGVAGLERFIRDFRSGAAFALPTYLWAGAPLIIGVVSTMSISLVGFGEVSVAPKRYPFLLARAISDGPALWHLEKNCDRYQYTVCEVFDEIPTGINEFLWEEGGLRYRATPQQMDEIRAEEVIIVRRAAREYPFVYVKRAVRNVYVQLSKIGLSGMSFGQYLTVSEGGAWRSMLSSPENLGKTQRIELLQRITLYGAIGLIGFLLIRSRSLTTTEVRLILLVAIALVANAVICGVLSGPADRYQGRIIWLAPLVAATLAANMFTRRLQAREKNAD